MASFGGTMFMLLLFFTLSAINSVMTAPVGLCSKPMDIAFIVDKSGSIGRKQLGYIKSFMEKTVDYFAMSDQENHYAIIEFGKSPRIIVNFNTFTEDEDEKRSANLKLKIKQMNRIDWGGGSFIDRALLAANSQLFTVGAGMRQNATKMAFVITDGIQTKNRGYFLPLHTAAEGLLKKGVQLFVVAIGGDIDISELGDIAADKNIFNIHRYLGHLDRIASKVCSTLTAVPTTSTSLK